MNGRSWNLPTLVAATVAAALTVAPNRAAAVELYASPLRVVRGPLVLRVPAPPPILLPSPVVVLPRRQVLYVAPAVRASRRVRIDVRTRPPVQVDLGPADDGRDAYDTPGIVVAGASMGGVLFMGDGVTTVATSYRLHVGLAVGAAEFGLRFDLIPDASGGAAPDPAALYSAGAAFSYRFLPGATVHPVFGVGLETLVYDPHVGDTANAFAVTARAGLEFAYPLAEGALALGIDVTGHHPFVAEQNYGTQLVDMVGFGAYADYRF